MKNQLNELSSESSFLDEGSIPLILLRQHADCTGVEFNSGQSVDLLSIDLFLNSKLNSTWRLGVLGGKVFISENTSKF